MMGVTSCASVRPARACCCPACPRAPPSAHAHEEPARDRKAGGMKVLKKIKRKMGLAPRSACGGGAPNNLPPLSFHRVHGENVRLGRDAATARRVESFCKGVAFSARPVRVNEKVCLRFSDISNNWSGVLRFGFTSNDPASTAHCLPKYACPDLTNKPGYWAKALAERFCEKDNVLFYYVTPAGDVHFGVNGEEKGVFFSGVETRGALWALLDIYGNCTAVQFCDPRAPGRDVDERLAGGLRSLSVEERPPAPRAQAAVPLALHRTRGRNVRLAGERGVAARVESEFCQGYVFTARPMRAGETIVVQILATESAYAGSLALGLTSCDPATLRPSELPDDAESLLDRPEYWVVRRDAANGLRRGDEMAVTLTHDGEVRVGRNGSPPSTVMHVDHSLRLWAFVDVYGATQRVRLLGAAAAAPAHTPPPPAQLRVQLAGAGGAPAGAVLVVSLPPAPAAQHRQLAAAHYIEPMGNQSQLCLTGLPQWGGQEASLLQCASTSQNNANQQAIVELQSPGGSPQPHPASSAACLASPPVVSCADRVNGQIATQLSHSVQLPYVQSLPHVSNGHQALSHAAQNLPHSSQNLSHPSQNLPHPSMSHSSQNVQGLSHSGLNLNHLSHGHALQGPPSMASSSHHQPMYGAVGELGMGATGAECTICYENPIDSVLYMCGHMCMCYRCAVQQWRGKGGGQCPLCRATIKDVIRTYKS